MPDHPAVFISYRRSDGEALAVKLRERLAAEGISAWMDSFELEGGKLWWDQAQNAIKDCQILALVATPGAFESENVEKEWLYARRQGTPVYPVMFSEVPLDFSSLRIRSWMQNAHFYNLDKTWDTFVTHLKNPHPQNLIPLMAPALLPGFVERPAHFNRLIDLLLTSDQKDPVALTTALRGTGGFGKTTLASALCNDERLLDAFYHGILWVTLGQKPDVLRELTKLYKVLTSEQPDFLDVRDAVGEVKGKLKDKLCLIVIDDVWNYDDLVPFLEIGASCTKLITTRLANIALDANARSVEVDEMSPEESVAMLTAGLGDRPDKLSSFLALATRLGHWPLQLEIVHRTLLSRLNANEPIEKAIEALNDALDRKGVHSPSRDDRERRYQSVAGTIEVGLERLQPEDIARFVELVIFPEDTEIPLSAVSALWHIEERDAEEAALRISNLALCKIDLGKRIVQLHDVVRSYLRERLGHDWVATHNKILDGYARRGTGSWDSVKDDYLVEHLVDHLKHAQRYDEIHALFRSKEWVKLRSAHSVTGLLKDFEVTQQLATDNLALRLRYMLFAEVVKQRFESIPIGALTTSYSANLITADILVSAARNMQGEPEEKIQAYLRILQLDELPARHIPQYATEVLEIVGNWENKLRSDKEDRARNFALLLELLETIERLLPIEARKLRRTIWRDIIILDEDTAKEFLDIILQTMADEECLILKEDILLSPNMDFFQRIKLLVSVDARLPDAVREKAWETIFEQVQALERRYDISPLFRRLLQHLPPCLQERISDEIWAEILTPDMFSYYGDYYYRFLEDVLPHVPKHLMEIAWQRAKSAHQNLESHWGELCIAVIAPHLPKEYHLELRTIADSMGYGLRATIDVVLAREVPKLTPDEHFEIYSKAFESIGRYRCDSEEVRWFAAELPPEIVPRLWERTLDALRENAKKRVDDYALAHDSGFREGLDKGRNRLFILASFFPATECPRAVIELASEFDRCYGEHYDSTILGSSNIAEIIQMLMARLSPEQAKGVWKTIFDNVLDEHLHSSAYKSIQFAFLLITQVEDIHLRFEFLPSILSKIQRLEKAHQRIELIAKHLHLFSPEQQVELWKMMWDNALEGDDKYKPGMRAAVLSLLPDIYEAIVAKYPSIFAHSEQIILEWNRPYASIDGAWKEVCGVSLLILHIGPAAATQLWERIKNINFNHVSDGQEGILYYLLFSLINKLPPTEQNKIADILIEKELYHNDIYRKHISSWDQETVWLVWEKLLSRVAADNNHYTFEYGRWAIQLAKYMPPRHAFDAIKKIKTVDYFVYGTENEIQALLGERLPQGEVLAVWTYVQEIKHKEQYGHNWPELEAVLAHRLSRQDLQTIVQTSSKQNRMWPIDIFTCPLHKYICYRVIGYTDLDNLQSHVDEPLSSKRRRLIQAFDAIIQCLSLLIYVIYPIAFLFALVPIPFRLAIPPISQMIFEYRSLMQLYAEWSFEPAYVIQQHNARYKVSDKEAKAAQFLRRITFPFGVIIILLLRLIFFVDYVLFFPINYPIARKWGQGTVRIGFVLLISLVMALIVGISSLVFSFPYSIACQQTLSKKKALKELEDIENAAQLVTQRMLIQRMGGRKLRWEVRQTFADAYTWWKRAVFRF